MSPSPSVLVIGATRGLGASLVKQYASQSATIFGTTRSSAGPKDFPDSIKWISNVDLTKPSVGENLAKQLKGQKPFDIVVSMMHLSLTTSEIHTPFLPLTRTPSSRSVQIITAGRFTTEDFSADGGPNWEEEVTMYTTSSIAPVFIVHKLAHADLLTKGSKVVLVSSESGSITLRHESEGGGNYAHHASKSALNMVGKLLSLDLKDKEVIISIVHPGFMRTEMTKGVGFDKYWDDGGAVTPDEAANSLVEWTEKLDMSKSGEYWAPRGPRDIGTAEPVLGKGLSTPMHLPW